MRNNFYLKVIVIIDLIIIVLIMYFLFTKSLSLKELSVLSLICVLIHFPCAMLFLRHLRKIKKISMFLLITDILYSFALILCCIAFVFLTFSFS